MKTFQDEDDALKWGVIKFLSHRASAAIAITSLAATLIIAALDMSVKHVEKGDDYGREKEITYQIHKKLTVNS